VGNITPLEFSKDKGAGLGAPAPEAPAVLIPPRKYRYKVTKQMRRRRAGAIHAYVGENGAGKTMMMVRDTIPSLDAGRQVLSTVRLLDSETGEPHPLWVPFTEWTQLFDMRDCDVLMDEITGIASSRESVGMPIEVQAHLDKLRKARQILRWTAPSWANADTRIRRVSQAVTQCRGYMPNRTGAKGDETAVLWAPRRLFRARTFPTIDFDEFDKRTMSQERRGSSKVLRPAVVEWVWGPNSRGFASYDTLDPVLRVGTVLDSGRCAHCGGRRDVPKCTCEHNPHPTVRFRAGAAT
jgi:hypothetical protein